MRPEKPILTFGDGADTHQFYADELEVTAFSGFAVTRSAHANLPSGGTVPTSGLEHWLYVHAHHALRALRGAAERHPEDEGIVAAQERLSAILAGLKVRPSHLADDIEHCPVCGQQRLSGHNVECGDDDSVSVDDVVGILAREEEER